MRLLLCLVSLVSLALLPTTFSQCSCTSGFPPTATFYSMISGDASCAVNYLEVFDTSGVSVYASGNASSRMGPFEITCPGSSISSFSFHCNDGSAFPLASYAALTTISAVTCANGQAASIVGLDNVCGGNIIGTVGVDPTSGTCSACTPGTCPATACTSLSCFLGPSPLDAPWPMMGQDPAHRSTSPYSGPQLQPAVAWSEGGGAYNGVTIGNDGTVFSSIGAVRLMSAYNGQSGQIAWTTLNSGNGSNTYTIGPALTILGNYGASYSGIFNSQSGALVGELPGSSNYGLPSATDITFGTDQSVVFALTNGYIAVQSSYLSSAVFYTTTTPTKAVPASYNGNYLFSLGTYIINLKLTPSALQPVFSFSTASYGNATSPSISIDSTQVFLGTSSGYALSVGLTTGALTWAVNPCPQACSVGVRALAVPSADGTKVFFPMSRAGASGYAGVIALSTTAGATQWTLSTNGDARSLALDASGLLFVGDSSGSIYGVRAASGAVVWTLTVSGAVANLAIGANSFLYVATNTSLVALH